MSFSNNQLALELLSLSAGLSQFSNLQIIDVGQQNTLLNIAPELIQFIGSCSACDNTLAGLFSSNINFNPAILNIGGCNDCLTQLVDLQGLFVSGLDLGNNTENANEDNNEEDNNEEDNNEEDNNEEENIDENQNAENGTAVDEGGAVEEGAAGNETAVVDDSEGAANETEVADGEADVQEGEGEEGEAVEEEASKETETPSSEGRKAKKSLVQRSAGAKRTKLQLVGSVGFGVVMLAGVLAL